MSTHTSLSGDRPTGRIYGTRSPVFARNGVIATSQPLASAAGLQVLQEGGNAIDAAVTAAAVLAVVEPTMTGVGGDLFALVFDGRTKTLRGLNASGRAGSRADPEALLARGYADVPTHGPWSITVPGSVSGWSELLKSHGTIPLSRALSPAIRYARDGFAVSEIVAAQWNAVAERLATDPESARVLLPQGRAPEAGEVFSQSRPGGDARGDCRQRRGRHIRWANRNRDRRSLQQTRRVPHRRPTSRRTRPIGSSRSAPRIAAIRFMKCRRIRRASSRSRCSTSSRDTTYEGWATTAPTTCTCTRRRSGSHSPIGSRIWRIRTMCLPIFWRHSFRNTMPPTVARRSMSGARPSTTNQRFWRVRSRPIQTVAAPAPRTHPPEIAEATQCTWRRRTGSAMPSRCINSLFDSFGSGIVVPGTGIALHSRGSAFTLAGRASQPARAGQAAVAHPGPRSPDERRAGRHGLRSDGRRTTRPRRTHRSWPTSWTSA